MRLQGIVLDLMDAFDALGIKPQFDLNLPEVEARHRSLSAALHPDKFAAAGPSERRMALGKAIEVNDAWRRLRDPVRRAESLLVRYGVPIGDAVEPRPSQDLLLEMMDVREELSAIRRAKDQPALARLSSDMRAKETKALASLSLGFAQAQGETVKLQSLLPALGTLRYFRRFFEELETIEDEFLS